MKAVASKSQGQAPAQAPAERVVIAKTEPGPGGKEAAIDKDQKLLEKAGRALMKVAIKAIEEAPKHKVNAHWVLQNREQLDHSYAQKGCIEGGFDQHGFGPDGRDQDSDATGRGKAVPSDCEVLGLSWMSGLPLFGSQVAHSVVNWEHTESFAIALYTKKQKHSQQALNAADKWEKELREAWVASEP